MTSGRYVAEKTCRDAMGVVGKFEDEESGDGVSDEGAGSSDGCEKVIWMPCTPTVQSRYDEASSKSVSKETLGQDSVDVRPMEHTYGHIPAF